VDQELEDALTLQLCQKYLRARDARHGILLLVHNKPKPRGWPTRTGKKLAFSEVAARLKRLAAKIAGEATDAPEPEIATLDVTRFANASKRKGTRKAALKSPKAKSTKRKRSATKSSKSKRSAKR
jgi:hypothetical protein